MRLFFALPLPEGIARIQTEVQQRAEQQGVLAKWPRPSGLHLTLAFLGEQAEATLPRLLEIGHEAAGSAFALRTTCLGGFPKAGAARILWLGVAPEPALDELCAGLRRSLLVADVAFDAKPFRPHITLARPRTALDISSLAPDPTPEAFMVDRIHLYQSLTDPEGPRYEVLASFPLIQGATPTRND